MMASDFALASSGFTKLSALIPRENKPLSFTPVYLGLYIAKKVEECLDSETGCYLLVTGVAHDMVQPIHEEIEELGIRKVARFTYEQTAQSLIIRLMPGALYENVSRSFCSGIRNKVANIPGHSRNSLCRVGATKLRFPGGRTKEGDGGFKPVDTRRDYDEWPSLMVEVGYSGSLPALRCDAEMWLENSGGRINMVIIIEIVEDPNELHLECWEMIVYPNGGVARNPIPQTPGISQYFDIDPAGTVRPHGHDLVIPYGTLFDTSQHGDPDIVMSEGELSEWALVMYRPLSRSEPHAG